VRETLGSEADEGEDDEGLHNFSDGVDGARTA
jgi:hypothetical protein